GARQQLDVECEPFGLDAPQDRLDGATAHQLEAALRVAHGGQSEAADERAEDPSRQSPPGRLWSKNPRTADDAAADHQIASRGRPRLELGELGDRRRKIRVAEHGELAAACENPFAYREALAVVDLEAHTA